MTRFFNAPLETLLPRRENNPSESDFWASLIVIGDGLSVTRFFNAVQQGQTQECRLDEHIGEEH